MKCYESMKESRFIYEKELMDAINIIYRKKNVNQQTNFISQLLLAGMAMSEFKRKVAKFSKDNNNLLKVVHGNDEHSSQNSANNEEHNETIICDQNARNFHLGGQELKDIQAGSVNSDNHEDVHQSSQISLSDQNYHDNQQGNADIDNHNEKHDEGGEEYEGIIELSRSIADFCNRSHMYLITPTAKLKLVDQIHYLLDTVHNLEETSSSSIPSSNDDDATQTVNIKIEDDHEELVTQHTFSETTNHLTESPQVDASYGANVNIIKQENNLVTYESNNDIMLQNTDGERKISRKRGFEMMIDNNSD